MRTDLVSGRTDRGDSFLCFSGSSSSFRRLLLRSRVVSPSSVRLSSAEKTHLAGKALAKILFGFQRRQI